MSQPTPSRYHPDYGNHSQTTTFKVLSRGRLRCVQTGEIVRKKGAEQLRNRRFAELHPRRAPEKPKEHAHIVRASAFDLEFLCTGCYEYLRVPSELPGTVRCSWCKRLHEVQARPSWR